MSTEFRKTQIRLLCCLLFMACSRGGNLHAQATVVSFEGFVVETVITDQFRCDGILFSTVQPFELLGPRVLSDTQLSLLEFSYLFRKIRCSMCLVSIEVEKGI